MRWNFCRFVCDRLTRCRLETAPLGPLLPQIRGNHLNVSTLGCCPLACRISHNPIQRQQGERFTSSMFVSLFLLPFHPSDLYLKATFCLCCVFWNMSGARGVSELYSEPCCCYILCSLLQLICYLMMCSVSVPVSVCCLLYTSPSPRDFG